MSPGLRSHNIFIDVVLDIKLIESVQRNFTKKIHGMSNKSYQDRLKLLNLPSLEFHRMRGDLIEVYKIIHAIYDPVTTDKLFTKVSGHSTTRKSNNLNLLKKELILTHFPTFLLTE